MSLSSPPLSHASARSGKQGAAAGKQGAAAKRGTSTEPPSKLEKVLEVLRVPTSVYLPPFVCVWVFRSASDLEFVLTLGTVYAVMVLGQVVMKKLGFDPNKGR